jgi:hypothetical protein
MAKPTAMTTIEPRARGRSAIPVDHIVKLAIRLSPGDPKYSDMRYVGGVARKALDAFSAARGEPDRRRFNEVTSKAGKEVIAVAVEGSVIWPGRPSNDLIDGIRSALIAEGYKVVLRETRQCSEDECPSEMAVEWNRPFDVPKGWHSPSICGKHDYKTCTACASTYRMTSTNASGPAPSLHCEVCGVVMVEWGGSKIWEAELITPGEAASRR